VALYHPYNGRRSAIATMHGKERVIAPILEKWFDLRVERAEGVDTDAFGTFSGEIERNRSMLEAARAKARLAIERTGARYGLASEGAFGPHPLIPLMATGLELMLLVDGEENCEIAVHRRMRANYGWLVVSADENISAFLERVDFPQHGLIVRPEIYDGGFAAVKGIVMADVLRDAIEAMAALSTTGKALVVTDMRAHLNPTRMHAIKQTAKALAVRIARLCPVCGAPGFGLVDKMRGLPCALCTAPTDLVQFEVHACARCGHQEKRRERSSAARADPGWCFHCNP
jgi:hypothetical protein